MLYLKVLNLEEAEKEYRFFQEIESENGFENQYNGISYEEFVKEVIPARLQAAKGINLQEGYVADTYFLLWDDEQIVGLFKVRHELNDFLRNGPGHIGYGIHPAYRRMGYASRGLALALNEAKKLLPKEEKEVYLSCHLDNPASLKVQLNNGAYIHHQDEREYYTRIKIR